MKYATIIKSSNKEGRGRSNATMPGLGINFICHILQILNFQLFLFVWGHIHWYSGLVSLFVRRDYSWWDSGKNVLYQKLNPVGACLALAAVQSFWPLIFNSFDISSTMVSPFMIMFFLFLAKLDEFMNSGKFKIIGVQIALEDWLIIDNSMPIKKSVSLCQPNLFIWNPPDCYTICCVIASITAYRRLSKEKPTAVLWFMVASLFKQCEYTLVVVIIGHTHFYC